MLIDYDWCGKEGEARYPPTIDEEFEWPDGVLRGGLMRKEHDDALFWLSQKGTLL